MTDAVATPKIKDVMKIPLFTLAQVLSVVSIVFVSYQFIDSRYQTKDDAARDRIDVAAQITELKTASKEQGVNIQATLGEVREISGFLKGRAKPK